MLHRVDHDVLENLYLTLQNGHFCPRHQFEKCPDFPTRFYHFEDILRFHFEKFPWGENPHLN